ncbi:MAG: hemolysin family protein [Actinomycetota bacterium]|nr:hemolysin family protein [Actinomycetota bacterium]
MSAADVLPVLGAAVLVALAGVFASLDAALSRVSRVRVEELVREERPGALRLQKVLAEPPRYLNLLLLLRVVAEIAAVSAVTVFLATRVEPGWRAVALAVLVMTIVSYVFIGVAPRTIGRQQAERVALRGSGIPLALAKLFGPLPRLLIVLGNALTPGRGFREGPFASEAELRDLVDLAEQGKVIEHGEREMIHGVFELGDTLVREVMVPRPDIVFIERDRAVRQALALALRSGFSRIPVIGENTDDVLGVAYLKDLVRRQQELGEAAAQVPVLEAARPPFFVPDSKPADELLREMQARRNHVAIVVDEYGGTAGLVTIEDILEEIVGEITDEYDRELPPVEQIDDDSYRVTARLPVHDLAELLDVDLPDVDVETVGGLLAHALGRVPIPGATARLSGLVLKAERAAGRRNQIGTVVVTREVPTQPGPEPVDPSDRDGPPAGAGTLETSPSESLPA